MKWKHVRWCDGIRLDWRNQAYLKKINEDLGKKLLAILFLAKVRMELAKITGTMRATTWNKTTRNKTIMISYSSSRYIMGKDSVEFQFKINLWFYKKGQLTRNEYLELSRTEKQL